MINKNMPRIMAVSVSLVLLLSAPLAFAGRYLVVLKDRELFRQTHFQVAQGVRSLSAIRLHLAGAEVSPFSALEKSGAQVQESLPYLQALVIEADSEQQAQQIAKTRGVALVEKEIFYPAPRPVQGYHLTTAWSYDLRYAGASSSALSNQAFRSDVGPKTPWGIIAVHAPQVWQAGNQGAASRIMVLDTGIDKDHPALKDNFEKGRDFTGESSTLPYPFADSEGHGTHVSGTIAGALALDGFAGVAPRAKILMGKVCGENGCSNIAIAAGMNWAISEKVDAVSMSLGGPVATGVERRAVEACQQAGIVVVAASGNDGVNQVGFPAAFPSVIAVGAVDKTLKKAKFSQWGPELAVVAPGVEVISSVPQGSARESKVELNSVHVESTSFSGSPEIKDPARNELVLAGFGKTGEFPPTVTGKFALISRGGITFGEKVKNAIAAGATGVVIYNNEPGLFQGAVTQDGSTVAVPVVMIEQTSGLQAKALLDGGQQVQASLQTTPADYASFAGTSMATPHVAGLVALIKTANKALSPEQVKNLLKSTSAVLEPNTQNEVGSGFVNAEKATEAAKTWATP